MCTHKNKLGKELTKLKYYSEVLDAVFDTEKELKESEDKFFTMKQKKEAEEKQKKAERTKRAKEVEEAIKTANEAQTKAISLLRKFTTDYGYFHYSYTNNDVDKVEKKEKSNNLLDVLMDFLN